MINKKSLKRVLISWTALLLVLAVFLLAVFIKARPLIFTYAKSAAETILLAAANQAVLNVLESEKITYDSISKISRDDNNNITGIEININDINRFKSLISNEIMRIVASKSRYTIGIPIGSFFSSEYTVGLGPDIKFRMQLTETAIVDFENEFTEAGLNQVLHRILIKINISANILMIGSTKSFSVSNSAIAAQTVIVGKVPESFTNVIEHPGDDIADEIFNYADLS